MLELVGQPDSWAGVCKEKLHTAQQKLDCTRCGDMRARKMPKQPIAQRSAGIRALQVLRERAGYSVRELADAVGWTPGRVHYWERYTKARFLPQEKATEIARHLVGRGTPPIEEGEIFALVGVQQFANLHTLPIGNFIPLAREFGTLPLTDGPSDVPILSVGLGGEAGLFTVVGDGEAVDFVKRPPGIMRRRDVFACKVQGDSMWPWRRPHELVYVERNNQPAVGDHVVVEFEPSHGEVTKVSCIRRLVALTATTVTLGQYNPLENIEYSVAQISSLSRVMEWAEVLGISA